MSIRCCSSRVSSQPTQITARWCRSESRAGWSSHRTQSSVPRWMFIESFTGLSGVDDVCSRWAGFVRRLRCSDWLNRVVSLKQQHWMVFHEHKDAHRQTFPLCDLVFCFGEWEGRLCQNQRLTPHGLNRHGVSPQTKVIWNTCSSNGVCGKLHVDSINWVCGVFIISMFVTGNDMVTPQIERPENTPPTGHTTVCFWRIFVTNKHLSGIVQFFVPDPSAMSFQMFLECAFLLVVTCSN